MKGFIVRPVSYIRSTAVAVADDSIRRMRTVDTTGQPVTSDTIHPTKYKVLLPRYHLSAVCQYQNVEANISDISVSFPLSSVGKYRVVYRDKFA